jgi:DNA modification methylase
MGIQILRGDCRQVMLTIPDASVDSIVTDPPYELGFMGKGWDRSGVANDVEVWKHALRILKPGGHLLAFGGSRTYHRLACAIEDAGFEIRDKIMWLYGSGFPKSHNIGGGRGTALKPAHETICLARKPLVGTVAGNVLEFGTGALNIDACRIEGRERMEYGLATARRSKASVYGEPSESADFDASKGRWPANVIHDGSDEVEEAFAASGEKTSGKLSPAHNVKESTGWSGGSRAGRVKREFGGDAGSASRFFYCAKASKADREDGLGELPLKYRANGTKWTDRDYRGECPPSDENGRKRANHHPTVKPTPLMRYLCLLITPPGGTVLDPFMGSGSTGRGAVLEGFKFIGIEMSDEYADMAELRIAAAQAGPGLRPPRSKPKRERKADVPLPAVQSDMFA